MNRRNSRRTSGERQEVEREIRQQGRKFINLKNLIYIKKQNKTIITKKKTKGKEKKEREREKRNRYCPTLNLGPSAHQTVSLSLRHVKHIATILIIFH